MPLNALPLRISQRFQKVPLRLALVTPFLLQISAAVGLTGYLSFRNGEQAVNDVAQQLRVEIGDRIHQTLSHYLEAPRTINRVNVNAIRLNQLNLQVAQGTYIVKVIGDKGTKEAKVIIK